MNSCDQVCHAEAVTTILRLPCFLRHVLLLKMLKCGGEKHVLEFINMVCLNRATVRGLLKTIDGVMSLITSREGRGTAIY